MFLVQARWAELYEANFFNKSLVMLEDYSQHYLKDFKKNFKEWDIVWQQHKTWSDHPSTSNIDGTADVPGKKPTNFVKSAYTNVETQVDCKNLLED